MNTKKWLKASMVALLIGSWSLPAVATAEVGKAEDLGLLCSGDCVDVWQVECKDKATTFVAARVKDPIGGHGFAVTVIGYKGSTDLIGQADREVSPLGTTQNSPSAWIKQPGKKQAATSPLMKVNHDGGPFSIFGATYNVTFGCYDFNSAEVGNPTVTLLQDQ